MRTGERPSTAGPGADTVLVSDADVAGLEMTLEIVGDSAAVARISASLAALRRGERKVQITAARADLAMATAGRLPGPAVAAVIEFCNTTLSASPFQSGTPLFGPLAGCYGAAHGAFRVVYRVDDEAGTVDVLDIHRQERAALGN